MKNQFRPDVLVRMICALAVAATLVVICAPVAKISAATDPSPGPLDPASWATAEVGSLNRNVLSLALDATSCAVRSGTATNPATLSVIDYSQPSSSARLWVFDIAKHALVFHELVAHGAGSGASLAKTFSNENNSHQSSLGLFLTGESFVGANGYGMRLKGLEPGFNDRAWERAIVMHGAWYVNDLLARTAGQIGRSWGCPAVRTDIVRPLIERIKGGGLLFAYYPDQRWLSTSKFLGTCAAAAAPATAN